VRRNRGSPKSNKRRSKRRNSLPPPPPPAPKPGPTGLLAVLAVLKLLPGLTLPALWL
ncbi:unnamed protein product, partial [Ectocarpus sp. 12 AP-2014]